MSRSPCPKMCGNFVEAAFYIGTESLCERCQLKLCIEKLQAENAELRMSLGSVERSGYLRALEEAERIVKHYCGERVLIELAMLKSEAEKGF